MNLYRLQVTDENGEWTTEWFAIKAVAKAEFGKLVLSMGTTHNLALDEVEVVTTKTEAGSGRENLAEALNSAQVDRTTWPGNMLARHQKTSTSEVEDLLS